MWRKFVRHRLAVAAGIMLIVMYVVVLFAGFFAPYDFAKPNYRFIYAPPQALHFFDETGAFHLRPFVHSLIGKRDPKTTRFVYREDRRIRDPVRFFVPGHKYSLFFGLIKSDIHFIGVDRGTLFLFGTDLRGRDMLSRTIAGGRVSLSIGLVGVAIMVVLGTVIGTISGYFGGWVDTAIQRLIELVRSFPQLPLWMAMAAVLPSDWPSLWVFFGITIVLALIEWTGLAREIRGKVLALRTSEFIAAAEVAGAGTGRIVFVHLIPNLASHVLITATLAIPTLILGESALSFLGLGIQPPMTSWGVLLSQANKIEVFRLYPWMLMPGFAIVITVLSFNYLGDGLRDMADPFDSR
jgi:peptide/nickel transport system permease protein